MKYNLNIKIFELNRVIKLPTASNPEVITNCELGDLLVCFDGKNVYAKDRDAEGSDGFVLLLVGLDFIEANHKFFNHL